jgi:hypothetical protein
MFWDAWSHKFHVRRQLADALDKVRNREYCLLSGWDRKFIKGQKYAPLSPMRNQRGTAGIGTDDGLALRTALAPVWDLESVGPNLWAVTRWVPQNAKRTRHLDGSVYTCKHTVRLSL